jgi:hypothetical protein
VVLATARNWKKVPRDIIRSYDSAPQGEPTLVIYNGVKSLLLSSEGGV